MRKLLSMTMLPLLVAACHGERAESKDPLPPAPSGAVATTTPSPTATHAPAAVTDANGAEVLGISQTGGDVVLTYSDNGQKKTLRGDTRDTGKRKYAAEGGATAYEVKPGDEGFKLRTANGTLLWKVKITAEKIKISNNEQNDNPFELKPKDAGRTKVEAPSNRELGNVRFDKAAGRITVENASGQNQFFVTAQAPAGAYGVLLLDGIPPAEKAILVAELLSRGK